MSPTIEQALAEYGTPAIVNTDQDSQFSAEEFISVVLAAGCKKSTVERSALRGNVFVDVCSHGSYRHAENSVIKKYEN